MSSAAGGGRGDERRAADPVSAVEKAAEVLAGRLMAQNPSWFRALSLQRRDAYARESAETLAKGLAHELAAAGLLPTDQGETRTEWGVRWPDGGVYGGLLREDFARQSKRENFPEATVVRREVTTGPWIEVPS